MTLTFLHIDSSHTNLWSRSGTSKTRFLDSDESSYSTRRWLRSTSNATKLCVLSSRGRRTLRISRGWSRNITRILSIRWIPRMRGLRSTSLRRTGKRGRFPLLSIWCGWISQAEEATMICRSTTFSPGFLTNLWWSTIKEILLIKTKSLFRK